VLIPALASVIPAFLWMIYFYRSDRYAPEPKKLVARTFLVGALVGAAMVFSLKELPFYVSLFSLAVFVAPFTEEIAKFLCVRWTVYNRSEFDEPVDGMVYATAAALGFASVENILYVVNSWASGGAEMLVVLGLLAGMVLHGLFNYLTSENLFGGLLFLTLMAIAWRGVFLLIRKALKPDVPSEGESTE